MNTLLEKLFRRRGIKDTTVLDTGEQKTYDNWQYILSGNEVTVDRIKEFCKLQLSVIEAKFKELDNSPDKNQRLIISHNIYRALVDCIEKPNMERENLEKYLHSLLE